MLAVLAVPLLSAAPSKEIVEMQRDIQLLQQDVREMQKTLQGQLTELRALVGQSLETSLKANASLGALESGLRDRLAQQLSGPMTGVSTKVDQMSTDFQSVRENVNAMNETLTKLQAQIIDLSNAVKILQAPAPPPPGAAPGGLPNTTGAAGSSGPPPGVSARQLYESAMKDRSAGNLDLALQGLQEFLKWFNTSELAPSAQYNIGQIHYDKNDFANAIPAFDAVLERYAENNKTADAMYMKGMALLKSGQRTQAAQEFLTVIEKYPNSEVATKARTQRKALGLSSPPPGARPSAAKRKR